MEGRSTEPMSLFARLDCLEPQLGSIQAKVAALEREMQAELPRVLRELVKAEVSRHAKDLESGRVVGDTRAALEHEWRREFASQLATERQERRNFEAKLGQRSEQQLIQHQEEMRESRAIIEELQQQLRNITHLSQESFAKRQQSTAERKATMAAVDELQEQLPAATADLQDRLDQQTADLHDYLDMQAAEAQAALSNLRKHMPEELRKFVQLALDEQAQHFDMQLKQVVSDFKSGEHQGHEMLQTGFPSARTTSGAEHGQAVADHSLASAAEKLHKSLAKLEGKPWADDIEKLRRQCTALVQECRKDIQACQINLEQSSKTIG